MRPKPENGRSASHELRSTFAMTMDVGPKAQHYIPRFYLNGFTDEEGTLWVYEKFKPLRASKPKHEANRPDYYTHLETGERDETAENVLMDIESVVAPIVRKLANPQYELTDENAGKLYMFVASMFARVPSWRKYMNEAVGEMAKRVQQRSAEERDKFHRWCTDFEKKTGRSLPVKYEELRHFVIKGDYTIEQASDAYNLGLMFKSVLTVAKELKNYGFEVMYAPVGKVFLTSDAPVFTVQPDGAGQASIGMGFGWPGVEVYLPLNKRACLRLRRGATARAIQIRANAVEQLNNVVMGTASQYLYSSEGYRRVARLFNERGCKIQPGKQSFMTVPK
jgi:Protein of unknown function (DUF4238)